MTVKELFELKLKENPDGIWFDSPDIGEGFIDEEYLADYKDILDYNVKEFFVDENSDGSNVLVIFTE